MSIPTRTLAAGAALLLIFGLGPSAAAPSRSAAERGVRLSLVRLNELLAKRDMTVVNEFVDADDTLLIGSEVGEKARGRVAIEAHFRDLFKRPETISFSWREVQVSVRGTTAWLYAAGQVVQHGPNGEQREPYILTGVLELHGGVWQWRMFHGAQPAEAAAAA
jgi:ketosteroid isomerase-like protein